MDDPGLEETINNASSAAKEAVDRGDDTHNVHTANLREEPSEARAMPTRWWYASTAFPLLAGTFGPMANAFSLCALVENWRVEIPPGGTEEHGLDIKDPRWLITVNAVSLTFALIANLSLLLNMTKRVRFAIAQPITILGFWFASILLIGLLSYASTKGFHAEGVQDQALTQAYYYGIFAASLYQIISYLMCFTVWGAYQGAYSKDFELTVAQRTLMLQTISFLVYLLVGALVFSRIEQWKFLDAVYFMDFTLLTVGIGDYAPMTHLGRSLLFPIAIGGIITIGLVVSSIRSLGLERGAEKMSARMTEKTRVRVVKQVSLAKDGSKPSKKPLFGLGKDAAEDLAEDPSDDQITELRRRKKEFEAMRSVQEMATREEKYLALLFSITAFAILWLVGAFVFYRAEQNQQWSYFQALYFSYTSVITIGYGDLSPMSNSGKPFFVFWSLLAVPTLTILISNMGDTVVKGVKDATIWLGEISFLPSSETRTRDRVRRGAFRATLGKLSFFAPTLDEEQNTEKHEEQDEDWSQFRSLHPGLVQVFDESDRKKINHRDLQILDRLSDAWSAAEEEGEETSRDKSDDRAQATSKKYSYAEWSFYLRLVGEDETDSSMHRRAVPKSSHHSRHDNKDERFVSDGSAYQHEVSTQQNPGEKDQPKPKWSWIGQYSPLMQEKDEAEWILERLFVRLEESLNPRNHAARIANGSMPSADSHNAVRKRS